MKLTIMNRIKLAWEVLTIRSGHSHAAQEKALSTFKRGYVAGLKDSRIGEVVNSKLTPDHIANVSKMIPEGYVLVPVEPTEKMVEAGYNAYVNSGWIRTYEIYGAMIQAAQEEE